MATQTNSKSNATAVAKAAERCPAGICNQGLQGWKKDESKSTLEDGSEAVFGRTDPVQTGALVVIHCSSGFIAKECPASQSKVKELTTPHLSKGTPLQAPAGLK